MIRLNSLLLIVVISVAPIGAGAQTSSCNVGAEDAIVVPKNRRDSSDRVKNAYRLPSGAVGFVGRFTIDADGHPNAYHPADTGLDALAAAGGPGNWWALATDKQDCGEQGVPVVQGASDPAPGYYVARTSMTNPAVRNCRLQRNYVHSGEIPYVAISPVISRVSGGNGGKGRLGIVVDLENGKRGFALHADQAPSSGIGEGSMRLARTLGLDDNPRIGGTGQRRFAFILFPSTAGFPADAQAVETAAASALAAWGGEARLNACIERLKALPR
jgi:hypothetical protein